MGEFDANINYNLLKPFDMNEYQTSALDLQNLRGQNQIQQQAIKNQSGEASLAQMRKQRFIDAKGDISLYGMLSSKAGDYEETAKAEKQVRETNIGKADLAGKQAGNNEKMTAARSKVAAFVYSGGTIEHALQGANFLRQSGDEEGASLLEKTAQQYPDAAPEQVREFIKPYLAQQLKSEDLIMPKYENGTQTNPNFQGSLQTLPMSTYQQGSQAIAQGNLDVNRGRLGLERQRLNQQMLNESPSSVKNKLAQEKAQTSANNSIQMLDEMKALAEENPRSTATVLAPLSGLIESLQAVWEPTKPASETPAIRMYQLRDAFLATVEALKKDGRMSNQDRQRLENAIGSGSFTSPESTKEAIRVVRDIVKSMSSSGTGATGNWKDL